MQTDANEDLGRHTGPPLRLVILAALIGAGCKPSTPGVPAPHLDIEVLTASFIVGETGFYAGDESGVRNNAIVDPEWGMVIHDLEGDGCAPSLVFYLPDLPVEREGGAEGTRITSAPMSRDAATIAHPDTLVQGYTPIDAHYIRLQEATLTLQPPDERRPWRWRAEIQVEQICESFEPNEDLICRPRAAEEPVYVDFSVSEEGDSQVDGVEASRFFDVVPSPDWTFEGVALPPCVPRLRG